MAIPIIIIIIIVCTHWTPGRVPETDNCDEVETALIQDVPQLLAADKTQPKEGLLLMDLIYCIPFQSIHYWPASDIVLNVSSCWPRMTLFWCFFFPPKAWKFAMSQWHVLPTTDHILNPGGSRIHPFPVSQALKNFPGSPDSTDNLEHGRLNRFISFPGFKPFWIKSQSQNQTQSLLGFPDCGFASIAVWLLIDCSLS